MVRCALCLITCLIIQTQTQTINGYGQDREDAGLYHAFSCF
ncbi:exported hypothetical protein [Bradyrhizobium sp. STM 3843]|nr:exported hypothetical protein [Bradyrhizobium sp. STM 3843]